MRLKRPSPGAKRFQRYPRTGALKLVGKYLPNRPHNFQTWLMAPLHVSAGRFRRLRREFHRKPVRAERLVKAAGLVANE